MNTETETVEEVQSPIETAEVESQESAPEQEKQEETTVPLAALQKERRKRQEAEQRAKLYEDIQAQQLREKQQTQPAQDNDDQYEAATKADLRKMESAAVRAMEERSWIRQHPERAEEVNEKLTAFLKQRPNLAPAIEAAQNRYEEAWTLMNALTPKQTKALKPVAIKRDAPGSPAGISKAAGMNQGVDVMAMTDSEYNAWRQSQRKRR